MRHSLSYFSIIATILVAASAQSVDTRASLPDAVAHLPACAAPCFKQAVDNSKCNINDQDCICQTRSIEDEASSCFYDACSLPEAYSSKNITTSACNIPIRDKSHKYSTAAICLAAVTSAIVLPRFIYKRFFTVSKRLGSDDWVMIATWCLGIASTICNVVGLAHYGLGRDAWTLIPHSMRLFAIYFYFMEIFYVTLMALIKISLSLFYLTLFVGPVIRRVVQFTVLFNICVLVVAALIGIFQCTPVPYFWYRFVQIDAKGHCININTGGWVHAAFSIAIDIWMLAIPMSQLHKINLHWKKKIGVTIMFLTGFFLTIISILRLRFLVYLANEFNPTWDQWDVALWSSIEVATGMVCTSLPTVRLILVRMCPRVFSHHSSQNGSIHYKPRLTPMSLPKDLESAAHSERQPSEGTIVAPASSGAS